MWSLSPRVFVELGSKFKKILNSPDTRTKSPAQVCSLLTQPHKLICNYQHAQPGAPSTAHDSPSCPSASMAGSLPRRPSTVRRGGCPRSQPPLLPSPSGALATRGRSLPALVARRELPMPAQGRPHAGWAPLASPRLPGYTRVQPGARRTTHPFRGARPRESCHVLGNTRVSLTSSQD